MKKLFPLYLLFVILCFHQSKAQELVLPKRLNLEKAQELAATHFGALRAKEVETKIANQGIKEINSKKLPQIYGDLQVQRNIILPVTPVPAIAFNPNANKDEKKIHSV